MDFAKFPFFNEQMSVSNEKIIDTTGSQISVYTGKPLRIAIIGEMPKVTSDRVTFKQVETAALQNNPQEYDAFFVTEEYFEELSSDLWTNTFENIPVPIFFIGLDVQAFVYYKEDMDYNADRYEATSHTQGFVREKTSRKSWGYGDPLKSTDPADTPKEIFALIFKGIEEFQASRQE